LQVIINLPSPNTRSYIFYIYPFYLFQLITAPMGRAPCCEKNGLKKGPWTPEEDLKLTNFIQLHGPGNWRTLPKNAGTSSFYFPGSFKPRLDLRDTV
jgi:hypothetical protein